MIKGEQQDARLCRVVICFSRHCALSGNNEYIAQFSARLRTGLVRECPNKYIGLVQGRSQGVAHLARAVQTVSSSARSLQRWCAPMHA